MSNLNILRVDQNSVNTYSTIGRAHADLVAHSDDTENAFFITKSTVNGTPQFFCMGSSRQNMREAINEAKKNGGRQMTTDIGFYGITEITHTVYTETPNDHQVFLMLQLAIRAAIWLANEKHLLPHAGGDLCYALIDCDEKKVIRMTKDQGLAYLNSMNNKEHGTHKGSKWNEESKKHFSEVRTGLKYKTRANEGVTWRWVGNQKVWLSDVA